MRAGIIFAAVIVAAFGSIAAEAQPVTTTKYQYYSVNGNSALEVYKAMLVRGPRVNGGKAYAATSAQSSQAGFLVQGQSCRIRDYKFKIDFVIQLPRMNNEGKLPPLIRSKWQQFQSFLKKHEETHRSIWMGCAKEFETKVASLKSGDCDTVDSAAARLWDTIRTACDRKHEAFDAAQQKLLVKHPFVRLVLGAPKSTVAAASLDTKKRKKTAAALMNW
jgi:predicted secreted Zn-dependent protease